MQAVKVARQVGWPANADKSRYHDESMICPRALAALAKKTEIAFSPKEFVFEPDESLHED
jgi:hypothetical protein